MKNKLSLKMNGLFKICLLLVLLLTIKFDLKAQTGSVGIGTITPNASAVLDISSTTKGVLVPRLTTVQRDAVVAPANGVLIYNTDLLKFNYWNGVKWAEVGEGVAWFNGSGVPPGVGNTGTDESKLNDLYLDVLTGDIYQRELLTLVPLSLTWKRVTKTPQKIEVTGTAMNFDTGASRTLSQTFSFAGALPENAVICSPKFDLPNGIIITYSRVNANNTIIVKFYNATSGAVSVAAENYELAIIK